MKIQLKRQVSEGVLNALLSKKFTDYNVKIRSNPVVGFKYIQVKKSAFVGVWIRIQNDHISVNGAVPSDLARGLLGALFLIIFISVTKRIEKEVGTYLEEYQNTKID